MYRYKSLFKTENVMIFTKLSAYIPLGGRELLCMLNHNALKVIYGDYLILFDLPDGRLQGARAYLKAFIGHIDGLTTKNISEALEIIKTKNISKVFVDGSNFGGFVASLKRYLPYVEVVSFFHNVEARFFWGALRINKNAHALAVLLANTLAERKAVRYSDKRICLSMRDSLLLKRLYGKGATHISPIALEDKLSGDLFLASPDSLSKPFALFAGSAFYANRDGIIWFVRHVVPRIDMPIYIVGRGFELLKMELEIPDKVTVIGSVYNLENWYRRAQFVIAPIFDGSGMKTKVAEALMFGKKIIGTPEAFSGYEDIAEYSGWVCKSPDEFVSAIKEAKNKVTISFYPMLRDIYLNKYSFTAATKRLRAIMEPA